MSQKLLRWSDVEPLTGISRTTAWREERAGRFPKRRRIGKNSVAWLSSEITDWIESRLVVADCISASAGQKNRGKCK